MNPVYEAAAEVQAFCESRGWAACIIGGLAVIRWGEPRGTQDVDLSLVTGLGDEERFVGELLSHFASRVPDPLPFALQNRIVLLTMSNRITVDIGLAAFPFEERMVERSTLYEFLPGMALRTCSAEDLVILKTIAGRGRDWSDIEGVAVVQGERLDWDDIEAVLHSLTEVFDSDEALAQLARIRRLAEEE